MIEELKKLCQDKVDYYLLLAEKKLKVKIPRPQVTFSISGRAAGRAWYDKNLIEFNPKLLMLNAKDFVIETTGHEVAHLIAYARHKGLIKAHGSEWKSVMWTFGLPANRCHNYKEEITIKEKKIRGPVQYKLSGGLIVRPTGFGRLIEFE